MAKSAKQPNGGHRLGPEYAVVTLLEYLDYECPYSAAAEKPIRQVLEAFEGEVALVVRQYPLADVHQHAAPAAVACEAAGLQGKFWDMQEQLFDHQENLDLDTIFSIADSLELDMDQFREDLSSDACQSQIKQYIAMGDKDGVEETPTVFVNGHKLEDKISFTTLSRAVAGVLRTKAAA